MAVRGNVLDPSYARDALDDVQSVVQMRDSCFEVLPAAQRRKEREERLQDEKYSTPSGIDRHGSERKKLREKGERVEREGQDDPLRTSAPLKEPRTEESKCEQQDAQEHAKTCRGVLRQGHRALSGLSLSHGQLENQTSQV